MNQILLAATATLGDKIDEMFYSFDMWVYGIFGVFHSGIMNKVAMAFTSFGDENFVIPVAVLALVLCLFKKTRKYGIAVLGAVAIGTIITNLVAKPAVLRIRPYNTLQQNAEYWAWYIGAGAFSESDYSFPSGHTTGVFEIAVSLGICLRANKKKLLSWVPAIIAFLTACSRIYLCVHYPTDVIGGMLVGTFAGVAAYFIACGCCKIAEKTKLDNIDLGKKIKIGAKPAVTIIMVVVVAAFGFSFVKQFSEGGDSQRCAYSDGEFQCYNEAKVDDEDYPAINGEEYCKIHWKELNEAA